MALREECFSVGYVLALLEKTELALILRLVTSKRLPHRKVLPQVSYLHKHVRHCPSCKSFLEKRMMDELDYSSGVGLATLSHSVRRALALSKHSGGHWMH